MSSDKLKILEEKLKLPEYAWLRQILSAYPEARDFWREFILEQVEKLDKLNPEERGRLIEEEEAGLKIEKQKMLNKYIDDYEGK